MKLPLTNKMIAKWEVGETLLICYEKKSAGRQISAKVHQYRVSTGKELQYESTAFPVTVDYSHTPVYIFEIRRLS